MEVLDDVLAQVQNSLSRAEILRSRSQVSLLFSQGRSFLFYPLKVTVLVERDLSLADGEISLMGMFMVAKRNHRRAVARNLLRRRIKEAHRLSRLSLLAELDGWASAHCSSGAGGFRITFSISYVSRERLDYNIISDAVSKIHQQIVDCAFHFVD